jgi:hypothetical protein
VKLGRPKLHLSLITKTKQKKKRNKRRENRRGGGL